MKKNKMMRIASVLLVAVLLSTCAISGTFAKYVTTAGGTVTSHVAYWGWNNNANVTISTLFNHGDANVAEGVIAPGTTGSATFAFGYTEKSAGAKPEVAYTFKVDVTTTGDASIEALDANPNFTWHLSNTSRSVDESFTTLGALVGKIKSLSGDDSGVYEYAVGTLPSAFATADEQYTISWNWAFEGYTVTEAFDIYEIGDYIDATTYAALSDENKNKCSLTDTTDTAMGNNSNLGDFSISITISATQKN